MVNISWEIFTKEGIVDLHDWISHVIKKLVCAVTRHDWGSVSLADDGFESPLDIILQECLRCGVKRRISSLL